MKPASICLGLLVLLEASTALSHHGNSEYDLKAVVRYEGIVIDHLWRNPHTLTKLATRTDSGEAITLEIEGGPPSVLRTGGFNADSIVKGEHVTAVVSPSRRFPLQSAYGHEIIKDDGSIVPLGAPRLRRSEAARAAEDIFGTWVPPAELFEQMRGWARAWELTEKGQGVREQFSPAMHRHAECVAMSSPMLMTYPVAVEFERFPDRVAIRSDWIGAERAVYLDGRDHPPRDERFLQGHSVGRWEDGVLVVDTTNFADEVWASLPSGEYKHLVERFALSEDGKRLTYSFVLEDPEYLARSVEGRGELDYRPDLEVGDIECDRELAERFLRELR
jgi:hypothetical protein